MASLRIVFKVLLRTAYVLVAAFELFGCAAPVAVTVVAADGATLAASGRSLSDHALSAATGSDCSALGLLDDGVLCRNRIPAAVVRVETEVPPMAVPPAPALRPAPADNSEATFLALGRFVDWDNADHTVVMGRFYNPLIVPLEDDKGAAFWVVALRPLAGGNAAVPIAQAKSIGFSGARTIALCRVTYRPGPCVNEATEAPSDTEAIAPKPATTPQLAQRAPRREAPPLY